jgi:transcriptional regulator with XRE-family HTH domain
LSPDAERSIGAYLARQRELRGISLDELATLTRIPRRSLERLESGVFDQAPDGFVRGFVRTVASALGLDPDETVMRLLREPAEDGEVAGGGAVARLGPAARWAALAVGACLVVGILAWLASGPRRAERPPAEADAVVVRRDLIRELARDAAARPAQGEAGPQPDSALPPPRPDPAPPDAAPERPQPPGPAATAREGAEPEPGQAPGQGAEPASGPSEAARLDAAPPATAPPADIP